MNAVPPARARRARTPVRGAVRLAGPALVGLVAALVVGILGMHGLGSHGAPAPVAVAAPAGPDQQADHEHGAADVMASMPSTAPHGDGAGDGSGDDSADGSGHALGIVMLCAVMLAAAALRLLALLATGHLRRVRLSVFAPLAAGVRARHPVRGHGPPHVWQFSVIRC